MQDYRRYPDEIKVREVKVGTKGAREHALSPRETPKAALGELFWQRWNVELDLRNIKRPLAWKRSAAKPRRCARKILGLPTGVQSDPAADGRGRLAGQRIAALIEFQQRCRFVGVDRRQFLSGSGEDTRPCLCSLLKYSSRSTRQSRTAHGQTPAQAIRVWINLHRKEQMKIEKHGHA